jgi:flagellar M-ring protein FliF
VKKTERTKSVSRASSRNEPVGPAGTPSNLSVTASNPPQGKPLTEKEEENETEYETPQTIDKIDEALGTIKRLTVAVVVDLSAQAAAGPNAQAPAAVTKEQIESIVKQAVGFDDQRNDKIEVLPAKLVGIPVEDPTEVAGAPFWERYSPLIRNASLGLSSLVALVLGLLILRRLRPVPAPATSVAAPQAERARQIAGLATQASANPEVVARIIRAWLKQSAGSEPDAVPFAPPSQAAPLPSSLRPAAAKRAA